VHSFIYNTLLSCALLAALPLLPIWLVWQPRFRAGLAERFGWYAKNKLRKLRPARPIWIHAASVGEVGAAGTLIAGLKAVAPNCPVVLSTFTATGNALARRCTGVEATFFLPIDHPLSVRQALTQLDPAALVVVETEIWPSLLREAYKRGIPTLMISGRVSERAFRRYLLLSGVFKRAVHCFSALGMQSEDDKLRITQLGAEPDRVVVTGNLKRALRAVPRDGSHDDSIDGKCDVPRRPLLVVGSSHSGEEETLLSAFITLKTRFPDLQMAVAPRHPERFSEVEKLLHDSSVSFIKRSQLDGRLDFDQDVLLIDTLGDLRKYYARAYIAFVGGSLVNIGGHNLLEPAFCKKPVLFGPGVTNFKALAQEMKESGGGIEVADRADLVREITALLVDPEKRLSVGRKAYEVAVRDDRVLEKSLDLLRSYIDFRARNFEVQNNVTAKLQLL
jgi:3-deoxy-D-manno-octulosonic-acid transferase